MDGVLGSKSAFTKNGLQVDSILPLYGAEFRAWQTSVLNALAAKVKTLTLPGGYVVYSQSWSNSDLGKNANDAISRFLANWANITNPPKP
jgi:hypothetical protein